MVHCFGVSGLMIHRIRLQVGQYRYSVHGGRGRLNERPVITTRQLSAARRALPRLPARVLEVEQNAAFAQAPKLVSAAFGAIFTLAVGAD